MGKSKKGSAKGSAMGGVRTSSSRSRTSEISSSGSAFMLCTHRLTDVKLMMQPQTQAEWTSKDLFQVDLEIPGLPSAPRQESEMPSQALARGGIEEGQPATGGQAVEPNAEQADAHSPPGSAFGSQILTESSNGSMILDVKREAQLGQATGEAATIKFRASSPCKFALFHNVAQNRPMENWSLTPQENSKGIIFTVKGALHGVSLEITEGLCKQRHRQKMVKNARTIRKEWTNMLPVPLTYCLYDGNIALVYNVRIDVLPCEHPIIEKDCEVQHSLLQVGQTIRGVEAKALTPNSITATVQQVRDIVRPLSYGAQ
eukprot:Clim_evm15s51 gene=Clim_evmTU15s51